MRKIIYIRQLFYYILVVLLTSLSTIVLHELGHFVFGLFSNCSEIKLVLIDQKIYGSYTEMKCPAETNIIILAFTGLLFVLPISMIYLFFFKNFEKYIGLMIIGFNFIISVYDLKVYLKIPFADVFSLLGIIIVIFAEYRMVKRIVI
ncbi:MAG: hypothetical protein RMJ17_03450 [Candidatus Aenigmarchaeota archaeon]|nr:M64 family metallopeptidase [Candidatus Aenigmarchaeota archaeon]MDW8149621.1 hypothetical protein [Candidatus Aenigmarchaeota archaeon]